MTSEEILIPVDRPDTFGGIVIETEHLLQETKWLGMRKALKRFPEFNLSVHHQFCACSPST